MTAKKQKLKLGLFPIKTKKDLEEYKRKRGNFCRNFLSCSGCGLINDYRSLSNYLKEFSDFIHWYEQMFDRKPFIKKSL